MEIFSQKHTTFQNQLLIAMPHLFDSYFSMSTVYICEHDEKGVMGLVINKPSSLTLGELFKQLEITCDLPDVSEQAVLEGGPVETDSGFVLHKSAGEWQNSKKVAEDLYLTGSEDILEAIAKGVGPSTYLVTFGYAGWDSGQLEGEVSGNSWLNVDANNELLFMKPYYARWQEAAKQLGVDINLLSSEAGHA